MRARSCATLSRWTATRPFLFDKINFLMDATVGFLNINQNKIIKIFSVASVALLPPTLIASVYGMNFRVMPELEWDLWLRLRHLADDCQRRRPHAVLPQARLAQITPRTKKQSALRSVLGVFSRFSY